MHSQLSVTGSSSEESSLLLGEQKGCIPTPSTSGNLSVIFVTIRPKSQLAPEWIYFWGHISFQDMPTKMWLHLLSVFSSGELLF